MIYQLEKKKKKRKRKKKKRQEWTFGRMTLFIYEENQLTDQL